MHQMNVGADPPLVQPEHLLSVDRRRMSSSPKIVISGTSSYPLSLPTLSASLS